MNVTTALRENAARTPHHIAFAGLPAPAQRLVGHLAAASVPPKKRPAARAAGRESSAGTRGKKPAVSTS